MWYCMFCLSSVHTLCRLNTSSPHFLWLFPWSLTNLLADPLICLEICSKIPSSHQGGRSVSSQCCCGVFLISPLTRKKRTRHFCTWFCESLDVSKRWFCLQLARLLTSDFAGSYGKETLHSIHVYCLSFSFGCFLLSCFAFCFSIFVLFSTNRVVLLHVFLRSSNFHSAFGSTLSVVVMATLKLSALFLRFHCFCLVSSFNTPLCSPMFPFLTPLF